MPMRRVLLPLLLLLAVGADAAKKYTAEEEKAVRMKTTRQLKEILTELKIKLPASPTKESLQKLALKHDAIAKWEELHPEKKKKPRPSGGMGGGMGGMPGMGGGGSMADQLWPMLDTDGDGKVTLEEFASIGGGPGGEAEQSFKEMDTNGDGTVSKAEVGVFFDKMQQSMGDPGMGGPGMGGPGMGGGYGGAPYGEDPPMADYDSDVIEDPDDYGEDDDGELPAHDEM